MRCGGLIPPCTVIVEKDMNNNYAQRQTIKNPEIYEMIYQQILDNGYVLCREVSKYFGKKSLQAIIGVFESKDMYVYKEKIELLNKDKTRYLKYDALFSLTELFDKWREEAKKINGQIDYVTTGSIGSRRQ